MIVLQTNRNIGDALCAIPALQRLAEREKVYLLANYPALPGLVNHPNVVNGFDAPLGQTKVTVSGLRNVVHEHPTTVCARQLGLLSATTPSEPAPAGWLRWAAQQAAEHGLAPVYDYVFAPHSNDMAMRGWSWEHWQALVQRINAREPAATIAFIGHGHEEILELFTHVEGTYATEYFLELQESLAVLCAARRAVVTIDSAPNRMCHALGIARHVLLLAHCVPQSWGSWPGARTLYGAIRDIGADEVLAAIARLQD